MSGCQFDDLTGLLVLALRAIHLTIRLTIHLTNRLTNHLTYPMEPCPSTTAHQDRVQQVRHAVWRVVWMRRHPWDMVQVWGLLYQMYDGLACMVCTASGQLRGKRVSLLDLG